MFTGSIQRRSSRRCIAIVLAVVLMAFAGSGCVTRQPLSEDYAGPAVLPEALIREFGYTHQAPVMEHERVRSRFGITVREMRMQSPEFQGRSLQIEHFEPQVDGPAPVILILPIFSGQLNVSRYFARHFVNQGWAVLVVDRAREELQDDILDPEEAIQSNIRDYMRLLDWVAANPDFDPDKVGVFGVSLGGMDAVMLAALDDRVTAVVAAMAGGDLTYVVRNTSYRTINRRVEHVLSESGLTPEAFWREMDQNITTEPAMLAPYVNAEDALLVLTRGDWIVPFEAQEDLLRSMGHPESMILPTGHRTSVVYFPLLRNTAHDFFLRRFTAGQD